MGVTTNNVQLPTESMIVAGFEAVSMFHDTDAYKQMTGCQGAAESARNCGHQPKRPADSGVSSWLCDRCGHHNIGSYMLCKMGNWLTLIPKEYCE